MCPTKEGINTPKQFKYKAINSKSSIKFNIEKVNFLSFPEDISTVIVLLDTNPKNQKNLNQM